MQIVSNKARNATKHENSVLFSNRTRKHREKSEKKSKLEEKYILKPPVYMPFRTLL